MKILKVYEACEEARKKKENTAWNMSNEIFNIIARIHYVLKSFPRDALIWVLRKLLDIRQIIK